MLKRPAPTTAPAAVVSAHDEALMEWMAIWKAVTAPQVARRHGLSMQAVYKRFARLESRKLVEHHKILNGVYASYCLTVEGYKYINSPYSYVEPKETTVRHGLGIVDIAVVQEVGEAGTVTSEREIAVAMHAAKLTLGKHDRRRGTDYAPLRGQGLWTVYQNVMHSPDLVITTASGQLIACEYERVPKSDFKIEDVLLGYLTDPKPYGSQCRWATVAYWCETEAQAVRLRRIAADLMSTYNVTGLTFWADVYEPRHSTPVAAGEWGRDKPEWLRRKETAARLAKVPWAHEMMTKATP